MGRKCCVWCFTLSERALAVFLAISPSYSVIGFRTISLLQMKSREGQGLSHITQPIGKPSDWKHYGKAQCKAENVKDQ